MKKILIVLGAIFVIFLMVSNATAVQQIKSEPIIKNVSNYKQQVALLKEKLDFYIKQVGYITCNIQPKGIIDSLIQILLFLIQLITKLIEIILGIMQLGAIILKLINALKNLITVITQFIEWLQDLFNPGSIATIQ